MGSSVLITAQSTPLQTSFYQKHSNMELNSNEISRLLQHADMKHFLDSVEKISREKEEETGNGRLQMFELENLLKSHLISDDNKADGVFFARPISKADDQSVTEEDSSYLHLHHHYHQDLLQWQASRGHQ